MARIPPWRTYHHHSRRSPRQNPLHRIGSKRRGKKRTMRAFAEIVRHVEEARHAGG